jgi:hypothetical protein
MLINQSMQGPRARAVICHKRAYDYDDKTGLYQYKTVDEQEAFNIVTDAGRVRIHTYLYGSAGQRVSLGGGLNYIGLSNDGTAPAAGDVALTGELTTNGLQRQLATVTLPTGSGTQTTLQKVFTYTGLSSQGVQKTALFDLSVAGVMAHEIQFAQRTLFQNDTLSVSINVTLS